MGGDGDNVDGGNAQLLTDGGRELSDDGAGLYDAGQQALGDAETSEHLAVPVAGEDVEHLGGGGDGVFGLHLAGQQIVEQVGGEEQLVGALKQLGAVFRDRDELEEGVDLHELDAGALVDLVTGNGFEGLLHHAVGAVVAVVDRVFEHTAVLVEQSEIDAPGVDADAVEAAVVPGLDDALLDLVEQAQSVPIEGAAHEHGVVCEAMDLFEIDPVSVIGRDHGASAGGAEIKCKYAF